MAAASVSVLVTMPFDDALLDRMRAVSPRVRVTRADAATADYAEATVLYGNAPPSDPARAPKLSWVQLHMAGVNTLLEHPIYTRTRIALTTTSGRRISGPDRRLTLPERYHGATGPGAGSVRPDS